MDDILKSFGLKIEVEKLPKDYEKNDILYCGVCNEPKQALIPFKIKDTVYYKKLPVSCKCMRDEYAKELKHKKENQRELQKKYLQKGLKQEVYKNKTFENFDNFFNINIKWAEDYANEFNRDTKDDLLFMGGVGTGKTHTACAIANRLIQKGYSVMMCNSVMLCRMVLNYKTEEEITKEIKECDLFIFDDLGAERNTETVSEQAYYILELRKGTGKPMIITTNLSQSEFKSKELDKERKYNRIIEDAYVHVFKGESYRTKKANDRLREVQ